MGEAGRAWGPRCAAVWTRHGQRAIAWVVVLLLVLALSAWLAMRTRAPAQVVSATALPSQGVSATALPSQVVSATALPSLSVAQLLAADKVADGRVLRLSDNLAVLAIEFPNLLAQGLTFNRVAALIEKKGGPRDRVLTDAELARFVAATGDNTETFYLGHDYTDIDLGRFFSAVASQQLTLNAQELWLRSLLLQQGVLSEPSPGHFAAIGRQAVISFSAVQPDDLATPQDEAIDAQRRASVLLHEFSHAQFFTRPDYQKVCWSFWTDALDDSERAQFRTYLDSQEYDAANEALMVNETQALLMHTPDPRAFNAAALGASGARLEGWRTRFRQIRDAVP